jgi:predicted RNA-binding Zn-ribbon protein involved in translation (DUF1610 family)
MEENVLCPRCGSDKILGLLYGNINTLEAFDWVGNDFVCENCEFEFIVESEES